MQYKIYHKYMGQSQEVFSSKSPYHVRVLAEKYRDNYEQIPDCYHHGMTPISKEEIPLRKLILKLNKLENRYFNI